MKLVASMIVRNELGRYLEPCLEHLLGFCDEIRIFDDGSTDEWADRLGPTIDLDRIAVLRSETSVFYEHEGRARQALLDFTFAADATHVLAIDADEFVSDGAALRAACEGPGPVLTLQMEEVWKAFDECLCVRADGGWRPHAVPILFRVPPASARDRRLWRIDDRALACGREPLAVRSRRALARTTNVEILHFGWTNEVERRTRYDRYVEHDGGRFHARAHLDSILWPEERVWLDPRPWPGVLAGSRERILDRANRG